MDTFFTVLMPGTDFKQKLALSRNFVTQFGSKLPETVVLIVSTTGKVWNVGLTRTNDDTFFENGWDQFAVENSLEENDFLVFNFNETDSSFDVLLFDKTACGKKTVVSSVVEDSLNSLQITENGSDDVLSGGNSGNSSESSENTSDRPWRNSSSDSSSSSVKEHKRGKGKEKAAGTSRKLSYRFYFQSGRRPVTTEEKRMALQRALAVRSTRPHFVKVMAPSVVYRRFFMTIPKKFAKQNFFQVPVTAILRVPGSSNIWKTTIRQNGPGIQHAGISAGWVDFVRDHNLEEGDACVFELDINPSCKFSVTIEVTIFRVVDNIVPLKRIAAH